MLKSAISSHNSCVLSFKKFKVAINVTNIKDINLKILCSFIHTHSTTCFHPKKDARGDDSSFLFTIIILFINFIHTWPNSCSNFNQLIKVTPSAIKVTPFVGGVCVKPPVGFFRLHDICDIHEKFGSTIFCCEHFLGASAKFLHLCLRIYLIWPPKTKTPAALLLERKR